MAFDIERALKDGLDEEELSDYLSSTRKFNRKAALDAGYTNRQVIDFLAARDKVIDAPMPTPKPRVPAEKPETIGVVPAIKEATKLAKETFIGYPLRKGIELAKSIIPRKEEKSAISKQLEAPEPAPSPVLPPGLYIPTVRGQVEEMTRGAREPQPFVEPAKPAVAAAEPTTKLRKYGLRPDKTPKGPGYFGELRTPDGRVSTELSVGVDFDGKETIIPTLVPTLTQEEINHLLGGDQPTESIMSKAVEHAKGRMAKGLSPFAQPGETQIAPEAERQEQLALAVEAKKKGLKVHLPTRKPQTRALEPLMQMLGLSGGPATPIERAKASNLIVLSGATGGKLSPSEIEPIYEELMDRIGLKQYPTPMELYPKLAIAAGLLLGGFVPGVLTTAGAGYVGGTGAGTAAQLGLGAIRTGLGVTGFLATKEAESLVTQTLAKEKPKLLQGRELKEFLGPLKEPFAGAAEAGEYLLPVPVAGKIAWKARNWFRKQPTAKQREIVKLIEDKMKHGQTPEDIAKQWKDPNVIEAEWRDVTRKPPAGEGTAVPTEKPLRPGPQGPQPEPEPIGSTIPPPGMAPVVEAKPAVPQEVPPPIEGPAPRVPTMMGPEPTVAPPGMMPAEPAMPEISPEQAQKIAEVRALLENTDRLIQEGGYTVAKSQPRSKKGEESLLKKGYKPMLWDPETNSLVESILGTWVKPPLAPEPTPEEPVTPKKVTPEAMAAVEAPPTGYFPAEQWWGKTPQDVEENWQAMYSHYETMKAQAQPEIKKLEAEYKSLMGPGSMQAKKAIKEKINNIKTSYEMILGNAETNLINEQQKHKEEVEQLASDAGLKGDDLENFLVDYDMAISPNPPEYEFNYNKTTQQIFDELLEEYAEKAGAEPLKHATPFEEWSKDPALVKDAATVAAKVGVKPENLEYAGIQSLKPFSDKAMHLWNVTDPKSPKFKSTVAGEKFIQGPERAEGATPEVDLPDMYATRSQRQDIEIVRGATEGKEYGLATIADGELTEKKAQALSDEELLFRTQLLGTIIRDVTGRGESREHDALYRLNLSRLYREAMKRGLAQRNETIEKYMGAEAAPVEVPPTAQHLELMPEEYPEIEAVAVKQDGKVYIDHTHANIVVENNLDPEKATPGFVTKSGEFIEQYRKMPPRLLESERQKAERFVDQLIADKKAMSFQREDLIKQLMEPREIPPAKEELGIAPLEKPTADLKALGFNAKAAPEAKVEPTREDWSTFTPNNQGYQPRELSGLKEGYFVAQQSPERFDIIETKRGQTKAIVHKTPDGWKFNSEVPIIGKDKIQFQEGSKIFDTPQSALLEFNRYRDIIGKPENIRLAQYAEYGSPHVHRNAVINAINRGESPKGLEDYPDLQKAVPKPAARLKEIEQEESAIRAAAKGRKLTPEEGRRIKALRNEAVELASKAMAGRLPATYPSKEWRKEFNDRVRAISPTGKVIALEFKEGDYKARVPVTEKGVDEAMKKLERQVAATLPNLVPSEETPAQRDTRDQIKETGDVEINPKILPLVDALNKLNIPTTSSGDFYGKNAVYVDLPGGFYTRGELDRGTDTYEKAIEGVSLPEGWHLIRGDMTASDAFMEGKQEEPYEGPRSTKTRLIRLGGAVSEEEAKVVAEAVLKALHTETAELQRPTQIIPENIPGMSDDELAAIRKGMPKYLNEMTEEQQALSHAVYAEQKKRYDLEKDKGIEQYNAEVEKAGYKVGDRVSYFARSMLGIGGTVVKGTVQKRKKYYVKLDQPFNDKTTAHLTTAWKREEAEIPETKEPLKPRGVPEIPKTMEELDRLTMGQLEILSNLEHKPLGLTWKWNSLQNHLYDKYGYKGQRLVDLTVGEVRKILSAEQAKNLLPEIPKQIEGKEKKPEFKVGDHVVGWEGPGEIVEIRPPDDLGNVRVLLTLDKTKRSSTWLNMSGLKPFGEEKAETKEAKPEATPPIEEILSPQLEYERFKDSLTAEERSALSSYLPDYVRNAKAQLEFAKKALEKIRKESSTSEPVPAAVTGPPGTQPSVERPPKKKESQAGKPLIGTYQTAEGDDFYEYGPSKASEQAFGLDLRRFAKDLQKELGWEAGPKHKLSSINVPPAGGDGTILMWKPNSEYGIYVKFSVMRKEDGSLEVRGLGIPQGEVLWRWTTKKDPWGGLENQWTKKTITPKELADLVRSQESRVTGEVKAVTPEPEPTPTTLPPGTVDGAPPAPATGVPGWLGKPKEPKPIKKLPPGYPEITRAEDYWDKTPDQIVDEENLVDDYAKTYKKEQNEMADFYAKQTVRPPGLVERYHGQAMKDVTRPFKDEQERFIDLATKRAKALGLNDDEVPGFREAIDELIGNPGAKKIQDDFDDIVRAYIPSEKAEVTPVPPEEPKEPWEMTQYDFYKEEFWKTEMGKKAGDRGTSDYEHKLAVKKALSEGKPVPGEVLKDYPELTKEKPAEKPKKAEEKPPEKREPVVIGKFTVRPKTRTRVKLPSGEYRSFSYENDAQDVARKTGGEVVRDEIWTVGRMINGAWNGRQVMTRQEGIDIATKWDAKDKADQAIIEAQKQKVVVPPGAAQPEEAPLAKPPATGNRWTKNSQGKIELYFAKEDFDKLPADLRNSIRRFFNWAPSRKAWVSKGSKNLVVPNAVVKRLETEGVFKLGEKAEVAKTEAKITTERIIPYAKGIKINNLEQLPHGTGARYLEVTKGEGDTWIAKTWRHTPKPALEGTGFIVDFLPEEKTVMTPAEKEAGKTLTASRGAVLPEVTPPGISKGETEPLPAPVGPPGVAGTLMPTLPEATKGIWKGTVYGKNYNKLARLFEKWGLGRPEDFTGYQKLKVPGGHGAIMDFNVEFLRTDEEGNPIFALSHYYEQEGDLVPDPDMEIRVRKDGVIEALTFQDYRSYQEVYPEPGKVDIRLKKDLNSFLGTWLKNIDEQGHMVVEETTEGVPQKTKVASNPEADRYVAAIKNENKKAYAIAYHDWISTGWVEDYQPKPKDFGDLSVMGAQAVRMELDKYYPEGRETTSAEAPTEAARTLSIAIRDRVLEKAEPFLYKGNAENLAISLEKWAGEAYGEIVNEIAGELSSDQTRYLNAWNSEKFAKTVMGYIERNGLLKDRTAEGPPRGFKAEMLVDDKWASNALVFATNEEAEKYASDLFGRWFAVKDKRVVPVAQPPNYHWTDEGAKPIKEVPGKTVEEPKAEKPELTLETLKNALKVARADAKDEIEGAIRSFEAGDIEGAKTLARRAQNATDQDLGLDEVIGLSSEEQVKPREVKPMTNRTAFMTKLKDIGVADAVVDGSSVTFKVMADDQGYYLRTESLGKRIDYPERFQDAAPVLRIAGNMALPDKFELKGDLRMEDTDWDKVMYIKGRMPGGVAHGNLTRALAAAEKDQMDEALTQLETAYRMLTDTDPENASELRAVIDQKPIPGPLFTKGEKVSFPEWKHGGTLRGVVSQNYYSGQPNNVSIRTADGKMWFIEPKKVQKTPLTMAEKEPILEKGGGPYAGGTGNYPTDPTETPDDRGEAPGAGAENLPRPKKEWTAGDLHQGEGPGTPEQLPQFTTRRPPSITETEGLPPEGPGAEPSGQPSVGAGHGERPGVQRSRRGVDHVIKPADLIRQGSWRDQAKTNLDVIELVKKLQAENRPATPEEQTFIAKYTGWGASELANNMFPGYVERREVLPHWAREEHWRKLAERLISLLTPEEIKVAANSTQFAHYTSAPVVRSIYRALEKFGFRGGKVFEPGMGTGNFFGLMPETMRNPTKYTGIEYDPTTSAIAKYLYPRQNILHGDFTKQKFPNNFFDLAIGNPPFRGGAILVDPDYKKYRFNLHEYFFAKSLDKIRPGGILAFVSSRYLMDKVEDKARAYFMGKADFIGAIRLPQTAFKENAGTEVVTDVLFFRKKTPGEETTGMPWSELKEVETTEGNFLINEYYVDHPEMVLGAHSGKGSMYKANEYTVLPMEGDIEDHFAKAVEHLPDNVYSIAKQAPETQQQIIQERDFNPLNRKEGGLYISEKGEVMAIEHGSGVPLLSLRPKITKEGVDWIKGFIGLRDAVRKSHHDQLTEGPWEESLAALQKTYQDFVKHYGRVNAFTTYEGKETDEEGNVITVERRRYKYANLFRIDPEATLVTALETETEAGDLVEAPVLQGRTLMRPIQREIKTAPDALAVSLDLKGRLDIGHISELSNRPSEQVIEELGDLIYKDPTTDGYILADNYLSGDVVAKLAEARVAAGTDPQYQRNVEALTKAQPLPLTPMQITVNLGAPWVPDEYVTQFAHEILGIPEGMAIRYNPADGNWDIGEAPSKVTGGYYRRSRKKTRRVVHTQQLRGAEQEWGTPDRGPNELLESVLNNKTIRITREDADRKVYLDTVATAAANDVAKKMKGRFKSWVWEDTDRTKDLVDLWNTTRNNIAPRRVDGSHLTTPGVTTTWEWKKHQKDAIWRIVQDGNVYLGHAMGAGKTSVYIAAGMEMKRLGLIRKPVYAVPKSVLQQFANEFQFLYPMANVMVADEENFHTDNRRRFVAQAALNNPDAIIITHSALGMLKMTPEAINPVRDALIVELRNNLEDLESSGVGRMRIKQMENRIDKLEQRFDSMIQGGDENVTFEDLGADFIFVDEAHMFRKLDFTTNIQAKGIDPEGSKRALDLYIKTRWLDSKNPGRSHVFGTGTPITNTIGELYTVMRYFSEDQMEKDGIRYFDSWAKTFGDTETRPEMNSAGRYEMVSRFSKFVNVHDLMTRVKMFMDVLTMSQLGGLVTRPEIQGGKAEIVITPPSEELRTYQREELQPRIEISRKWKPSKGEKGNPDPLINIITDGRLAAIDMRYVRNLPNDPNSKLNKWIDGIIESHKALGENTYLDEKGNPSPKKGGTIIGFYNLGFGEQVAERRGFNARSWTMKRFKEAGIPSDDVIWFMDYAGPSQRVARMKVQREFNKGNKRILIGSAKTMGVGLNPQNRLAVSHYLDNPWYPADVEQPDGRILRQGNQNKIIEMKRYATKGSYDATQWQMVARKSGAIETAFTGENVRVIEDISETSQYEMAAALAAGDERAIRVAVLKGDIENLRNLQSAHYNNQRDMEYKRTSDESSIRYNRSRLKKLQEAYEKVDEYVSRVKGKVGEKSFDTREPGEKQAFGEAIIEAYKGMIKKPGSTEYEQQKIGRTKIGVIGGEKDQKFPIYVRVTTPRKHEFDLHLELQVTPHVEYEIANGSIWPFDEDTSPAGLVSKFANKLTGISSEVSQTESSIRELDEEIKKLNAKIGTPYPNEQEMNEKIAELSQLEGELLAESAAAEIADAAARASDPVELALEQRLSEEYGTKVTRGQGFNDFRFVDKDRQEQKIPLEEVRGYREQLKKELTPQAPASELEFPDRTITPDPEDRMNHFFLSVREGEGRGWREVKGKSVKIKGFEDFDLFLHKNANPEAIHQWVISEGKSGFSMASGTTQKDAIATAEKTLSSQTVKDLEEAIQKGLKEIGETSPRYGREKIELEKGKAKQEKKSKKEGKKEEGGMPPVYSAIPFMLSILGMREKERSTAPLYLPPGVGR